MSIKPVDVTTNSMQNTYNKPEYLFNGTLM